MSNLNTLLEAARFVEMQEEQQRAAVEAAIAAASKTTIVSRSPTLQQQQQSSSSTLLHSNNQNSNKMVVIAPTNDNIPLASPSINSLSTRTIISSNNHQQQRHLTVSSSTTISSSNSNIINSKKQQLEPQQIVTSIVNNNANRQNRILHNSFDIIRPLIIDETNSNLISNNNSNSNNDSETTKRQRQLPIVLRADTREVHNKLEKHRRAHLKECFELLKNQLPIQQDEKKISNLSILHSALRYIKALKREQRESELEMERLACEKISLQNRLAALKKELTTRIDNVDFTKILPVGTTITTNNETNPITTTTKTIPTTSTMINELSTITTTSLSAAPSIIQIERNSNQLQQNSCNSSTVVVGSIVNNTISNVERLPISLLPTKSQQLASTSTSTTITSSQQIKEVSQQQLQQQSLQTTALSVLPVNYPVPSGLVLQKLIVPKSLTDLTPLMSTHFITTTPQAAKVVPTIVVKPLTTVVVSTPSPRPS